jgi:hypothetical protein
MAFSGQPPAGDDRSGRIVAARIVRPHRVKRESSVGGRAHILQLGALGASAME